MEEQIIDDSFGLTLNDQMRDYIHETAKWTYFLSILGLISVGFLALGSLFMGVIFGTMTSQMGYGASGGLITILYLGILLLFFFPVLYLFRFSTKVKAAMHSGSDMELTEAFQNLKSHYKFVGILAIVALSLYMLSIMFFGMGVLAVGSGL